VVAFATPQQLADRSQGAITVAAYPSVQLELDAATAAIQNACGWPIVRGAMTFTRRSRIPSIVFLPAMQIVSVESVSVNGVDVDAASVEVDPNTGETNIYGRIVEVAYTAGFDPMPADIVQLTLEMAAIGLGSATGLEREQAGAVSLTYKQMAEAELSGRLAAYRLGWIP
jgi:hypothetical protein